jgi:hypothetical protein
VKDSYPGVALLTAEATVYGKRLVDSLWYTVGYPLWMLARYGSPQGFGEDTTFYTKPNPYLPNGTLTIGQGGVVLWTNMMYLWPDDSLDVEFDDPTNVLSTTVTFNDGFGQQVTIPADAGGNIPSFPRAPFVFSEGYYYFTYSSVSTRARRFPQPGTYHWVSQHQGIDGRVVVVSNDSLKRPTLR